MDDHAAVARLKRGDIGGLEALVARYQTPALRAAYLICLDSDLARDVTQDAFLRAYQRIDSFDAGRPFGPWFMRLVVNQALMALREGGRTETLPEEAQDAIPDGCPGLEEIVEAGETQEAVRSALSKLTPKQRSAVVWRYYLGLSEAEMSQALNCPRGTVKRRLHDARQSLRRLLPAWVWLPFESTGLREK